MFTIPKAHHKHTSRFSNRCKPYAISPKIIYRSVICIGRTKNLLHHMQCVFHVRPNAFHKRLIELTFQSCPFKILFGIGLDLVGVVLKHF